MPTEKFLKQVADYYIDKGTDMTNTTFVFPNRRSAAFMHKYMKAQAVTPVFKPRMISITYFTQLYSNMSSASDTELVFLLYESYCEILKRHGRDDQISDFDRFYFWGSIILKDFSDVDAYLVDTKQLYSNLKAFKEIKSNYLTPEQVEVIKYLWGIDYQLPDEDEFWQHMRSAVEKGSEPSTKFLNLWEIMGELYDDFTARLKDRKPAIAYAGLQSRLAYENLKGYTAEEFNDEHFVFVGFNVLSTARTLIFKRLKELGIADFFWDVASPLIADVAGSYNSNGRFVLPLARQLSMPDDFDPDKVEPCSDIEVIAVPSGVGQTKVASEILDSWAKKWVSSGDTDALSPERLVNTAVVLADESLLMPMLYSVSPAYSTINVTMGISYSSTPFASLMSSIISMHLRARKAHMTYYYADVLDVISHQYISMIEPDLSLKIRDDVNKYHMYTVKADELISKYPQLSFLFKQIDDDRDIEQVRDFIDNLVNNLRQRLSEAMGVKDDKTCYELSVLDGYTKAVADLCKLIKDHNIHMEEHTFMQMIERTLSLTPIKFAGQPLKGLQIMSVMDTRALDFDNIIMLSMNERIFPRRNFNPSMIPMSLRAAYGMPTQDHEDSSYSYQFYRLISRAKRVRLLYDSRTGGLTSGEMSRFLSQLLFLHPELKVRQRTVEFNSETEQTAPIVINKTPEVIRQLHRFYPGGDLKISASALKAYLSCPLKFYLQFVKGLRPDNDELAYIDAASYGTIIHELARSLYLQHARRDDGKPVVVNEYLLEKMINDNLEQRALEMLNEKYYKGHYHDLSMIPGEGKIISKIIAQYVKHMLKQEKKLGSFVFCEAEFGERVKHEWKINDKYTINFTMSIDRIDKYRDAKTNEEILRFIDYKTGSDSLKASSLDDVFEKPLCSGMFQLLLYSHAYRDLYNGGKELKIKPIIYKFQTIPKDGIENLTIHKKAVEDYHDVDKGEEVGFYTRFEKVVDDIFEENNDKPFCQTDDVEHCTYCPFTTLCGRFIEDKKF